MEFANLLEKVLDFRANYPEAVSGIIGVFGFLVLFLVRRLMASTPMTPEATTLASLMTCKDRWRWGVTGQNTKRGVEGTPTGNSIVCVGAQGQKVVALFKGDKYTVDGEVIDLTKGDRKKLRKLRNDAVAHLTAIDKARKLREEAKARQVRFAKLTNLA